MAETTDRTTGAGRIIVMVYAILALAASWRSGFQLLSKFDDAPVAFILSGVSGLVYIVATIALAIRGLIAWQVAYFAVWFDLIGVIVVVAWSIITPEMFPVPTVLSAVGIGYGFIPLFLPMIGLYWLYKHQPKSLT